MEQIHRGVAVMSSSATDTTGMVSITSTGDGEESPTVTSACRHYAPQHKARVEAATVVAIPWIMMPSSVYALSKYPAKVKAAMKVAMTTAGA